MARKPPRGGGGDRGGPAPRRRRPERAGEERAPKGEGTSKGEATHAPKGEGGRGSRRDSRNHRGAKEAPKLAGGLEQLEGRNVVLAALQASKRVRSILLDERAKPHPKLAHLLSLAKRQEVEVKTVPRTSLDKISQADVHNGIIALADPLPRPSLKEVLVAVEERGEEPFILLLDEVQYEQNLGAILRTAAWSGVHALVVPTRRGADLSAVVQRVAMGGAEVVPVVREGLMSALATLRRRGLRIVGADSHGDAAWCDANLTGPLALVMGGEDHGIGKGPRSRCDQILSIPTAASSVVTSLNVSVATALLLGERLRQTRPWEPSGGQ